MAWIQSFRLKFWTAKVFIWFSNSSIYEKHTGLIIPFQSWSKLSKSHLIILKNQVREESINNNKRSQTSKSVSLWCFCSIFLPPFPQSFPSCLINVHVFQIPQPQFYNEAFLFKAGSLDDVMKAIFSDFLWIYSGHIQAPFSLCWIFKHWLISEESGVSLLRGASINYFLPPVWHNRL